MIEKLSEMLPYLAVTAGIFGYIGWSIRGGGKKSVPTSTKAAPAADKGQQERAKNLEAALEKSKAAHKSLKAELETLKSTSIAKSTFEDTTAELETARKSLDTETKRIATLETELRKAQEAVKHLNSRSNEADKAQKDRSFALENELSKAREQLAILENRTDNTTELHAEIERLRESVAVSTRYAGEMRKREAAAVEALEKAQAQFALGNDPSRPAASRKIGPVVSDSGRIAAAKAEVIRLVEMNKQREAEAAALTVEELPQVVEVATELETNEELPVAHETEVFEGFHTESNEPTPEEAEVAPVQAVILTA